MEGCPGERREKEVAAAGAGSFPGAEIPAAASRVAPTPRHLRTSVAKGQGLRSAHSACPCATEAKPLSRGTWSTPSTVSPPCPAPRMLLGTPTGRDADVWCEAGEEGDEEGFSSSNMRCLEGPECPGPGEGLGSWDRVKGAIADRKGWIQVVGLEQQQ